MSQNISIVIPLIPDQGVALINSHEVKPAKNPEKKDQESSNSFLNENSNKHSQEGDSTNSEEHNEKKEDISINIKSDKKEEKEEKKFIDGDYEMTEIDYDLEENQDYPDDLNYYQNYQNNQFLGQKRSSLEIGDQMMENQENNKNITINISKNLLDQNYTIYEKYNHKKANHVNKSNSQEKEQEQEQEQEKVIILNEEEKNKEISFSESSSNVSSNSSDEEFKLKNEKSILNQNNSYKYLKTPEELKKIKELKEKKRIKLEKRKKEKEEALIKDTFIFTPYAELINLTQEYGFNLVIDLLIYYTNGNDINNDNEEKKDEKISEIEEKLKNLATKTNKQILSLYLLKLIYLYQKKNFQIYRDFEEEKEKEEKKIWERKKKIMLFRKEYWKNLTQKEKDLRRLAKEIKEKLKNNNLSKEERHKEKKRLKHIYHKEERYRKKEERHQSRLEELRKEKAEEHRRNQAIELKLLERFQKQRESKYQSELDKKIEMDEREALKLIRQNNIYRNRHFHWKDNFLYAYVPKDFITRPRCFLYCWKTGCRAKVRIDMDYKTCEEIGEHIPHNSFDPEKTIRDYPGLKDKDWQHIQYDIKGDKRFIAWKI